MHIVVEIIEYVPNGVLSKTIIKTGLESIENYSRVASLKEQQVAVLRQAASTANDLFVAGLFASYLEVVPAQRSVLEAELELTATKKQQFLSIVDL